MKIPLNYINWIPCLRIVPSIFPPVHLFTDIADVEDFEILTDLESKTNDRIQKKSNFCEVSNIIIGSGVNIIKAAFLHCNPQGSRFSDGSFGVYYASSDLDTAIAETIHHREKFLRSTNESYIELDMRVYMANLSARMHDIRGMQEELSDIYNSHDYKYSQEFAKSLKSKDSAGIVYSSMRSKGYCAAVFKPSALSNCIQERHLTYIWDGHKISEVYEKSMALIDKKLVFAQ